MKIQYYTADVFTDRAFGGAQIAVVPEAEAISSEEQLRRIAAEFNLPATVFISTLGQNHFTLRLFTPAREINFGSHTTIAAAHVLASIGRVQFTDLHTPLVFEHKDQTLQVHVTHDNQKPVLTQLTLSTKPIVDNYVPSPEELAEILGLDPKELGIKKFKTLLVSNNGVYVVVPIRRFDALYEAAFHPKVWNQSSAPSSSAQHLLLFSSQTETLGSDFHLRLLGPQVGVGEDPPVGEAIPAFAAYLCSHDHVKKGTYSFIAERGTIARRQSLLHIELDNKPSEELTLRVGGTAVLVCEGTLHF